MCVDIGRFDTDNLMTAANAWVDGLLQSGTHFKRAIVLTNMPLKNESDGRIQIRQIDESFFSSGGSDTWQELLYLKFKYSSQLSEEYGSPPVWLDLDSYVSNGLNDLLDIEEFCTMLGSSEPRAMQLVNGMPELSVPRHDLINGSFFRFGKKFLGSAMDAVDRYRGKLPLGDQDAINLVYHFGDHRIPVLGRDIATSSIYSFDAWNTEVAEHIDATNSRHLYWDDDGKLRSRLHPGKTVDLVQFTFRRFIQLLSETPTDSNEFLQRWRESGQARHLSLR